MQTRQKIKGSLKVVFKIKNQQITKIRTKVELKGLHVNGLF